jgi:anti-sigma B factor antagonist
MCVCSVVFVADATEEFDVGVTWESATATIVVSGELDLATCPQLVTSLDGVVEGRPGDVVVDLSGVTFLDSTALTVLITFRQQLQGLGRRLVLDRPSPVVVRVLTISGLLDTFAVPSSDG